MTEIAKTVGKAAATIVVFTAAVIGLGALIVHQSPKVERRSRYA